MKLFKSKKQQPQKEDTIPVKFVKTIAGHLWYEYESSTRMPIERAIQAEIAMRYAQMKIDADTLNTCINEMVKFANAGQIVNLFALLKELQTRQTYSCEEGTLTNLALVYFIMDKEPADKFLPYWQEEKRKVFEKHPEVKGFFLQRLWERIQPSTDTLKQDIVRYFEDNKDALTRLEELLKECSTTLTTGT